MQNIQNHPLAGARDLDSAMNKLWDFYKKYFVGLYLISLVAAILSSLISASLDLSGIQSTTDLNEMLATMKGMILPYSLLMVVSFVMGVILHAYVLEKPLEHFSLLSMLSNSLIALLPYLLTIIVMGIAASVIIAAGFIMLILPGLFAIMYCGTIIVFALPVTLAESRNPGTIIERSFRLAHRNLWPNMGWLIVVVLIVMVISLLLAGIVMLPFTGTFIKSFSNPENAGALLEMAKNPVYIALNSVTSAFITPVIPILAFILYFRNRQDVEAEYVKPVEENRVTVEDLYPKMPDKE